MSRLITILIVAAAIFFVISSVRFVRIILTVLFGVIYIPINRLNNMVQAWYFKMKHKDKIIYYAFTPFYWILVAITFIVSIPYEFIIAVDLH